MIVKYLLILLDNTYRNFIFVQCQCEYVYIEYNSSCDRMLWSGNETRKRKMNILRHWSKPKEEKNTMLKDKLIRARLPSAYVILVFRCVGRMFSFVLKWFRTVFFSNWIFIIKSSARLSHVNYYLYDPVEFFSFSHLYSINTLNFRSYMYNNGLH